MNEVVKELKYSKKGKEYKKGAPYTKNPSMYGTRPSSKGLAKNWLTCDQLKALQVEFAKTPVFSFALKKELASRLGLTVKKISKWVWN